MKVAEDCGACDALGLLADATCPACAGTLTVEREVTVDDLVAHLREHPEQAAEIWRRIWTAPPGGAR